MRTLLRRPFDDVMNALEKVMIHRRARRAMILFVISLIVTWFIYVPIHELLHAYGCKWTGGEISRLEIQAHYGGAILQKYFPFVVTGGDYAGRLSGFDTHGNDWIYLATDFAPFVLSVLIGVPLLRVCTRRHRPLLLGTAVVVGLAPFYNLPGDYYEMASIMTTRTLTWLHGSGQTVRFEGLRSDDIYTLIPNLFTKPAELGLDGSASSIFFACLVVLLGIFLSIILAFATYAAGDVVARVLVAPAAKFSAPQIRSRTDARKQHSTASSST